MKTIASILRTSAEALVRASTLNAQIKYTTKSHYGGPELVYVVSEHKEPLQTLTGSKTLTDRHVKALKDLGFNFEQEKAPGRILD
jgi:hypothetical protein